MNEPDTHCENCGAPLYDGEPTPPLFCAKCRPPSGTKEEVRSWCIRQSLAGADGRVTFESIMGFMKRSAR